MANDREFCNPDFFLFNSLGFERSSGSVMEIQLLHNYTQNRWVRPKRKHIKGKKKRTRKIINTTFSHLCLVLSCALLLFVDFCQPPLVVLLCEAYNNTQLA